MSNIIFPALKSPNWKLTRTPFYKTMAQESASGNKYVTAALRSGKLMRWTLKNGVLQAASTIADLQAIQNLFDSMLGMYDSFLFKDPESQTLTPGYDAYHPVKFLSDSLDFDRLCYQIWQAGELSFRQVGLPTLNPAGTTPPQIGTTATITAATLTVSSSFAAGNSGVGTPVINAVIGAPAITQIDQSGGGLGSADGHTFTAAEIPSLGQLSVVAFIQGTLFADGTTPDTLQVFDAFLTVTNADGSTSIVRPTTATVVTQDTGIITNPANAVDGSGATAATITRTHYRGTISPSYLLLTGFTF